MYMNIIKKIFEIREDELIEITPRDRIELLKLYPEYYESSNLENFVEGNEKLETAFEKFSLKTSTENSYLNKKFYLAGLKDGINIMKFAKEGEVNDY